MRIKLIWFVSIWIALFALVNISFAQKNRNAKWALHFAGPHNCKTNTCDFQVTDCYDLVVDAPAGPGNFDVYILAVDVDGIAGTRFGLYGEGHFYFYDGACCQWTRCGDLEIPTSDWVSCGAGNAITWISEQPPGHLTIGLMHFYVYGEGNLWVGPDPRSGFAEWCDGTSPEPLCYSTTDGHKFGLVSFGGLGNNPCRYYGTVPGFDLDLYGYCGPAPVRASSWGMIKALYK